MKLQSPILQTQDYPMALTSNLVVREINGEVLIYNLETYKTSFLDEVSALIWRSCDGRKSVAQISFDVSWKLNSNIDEELIKQTIAELKRDNLIIERNNVRMNFDKFLRRRATKPSAGSQFH